MDDLELQRLKAVADAAQAVRKAASVIGYHAGDSDYTVRMDMPARAWEALADALNVLDKGREIPEMEYDNGPWATVSASHGNIVGYHFPGPDVSLRSSDSAPDTTAVPGKAERSGYLDGVLEANEAIRITRLRQGFVVALQGVFTGDAEDDLAFTDAIDLTEWLLGWLGFDEEIVESVRDILAGLWDADELVDREARLDARGLERLYEMQEVAEAAQAYVERGFVEAYDKLAEAVKKWRGIEGHHGTKTNEVSLP